jgi:hypothetical protein
MIHIMSFLTSRLMASLGSCGIVQSNALSQPREIASFNIKVTFIGTYLKVVDIFTFYVQCGEG